MHADERTEQIVDAGSPLPEGSDQQPSRGDFLKWGTVALGGLYVGPKITSFAVNGTVGQAGSPAPGSHSSSSSSSYSYSSSTSESISLPTTGGAAGQHTAATVGNGVSSEAWIPVAAAGTAAAGWYLRKQGKKNRLAGETVNGVEETR